MRIVVSSVFVEDQEEALGFYTEVLGFQKKADVPVGEFRWLTVVSPEEPDGVELLLASATKLLRSRLRGFCESKRAGGVDQGSRWKRT